MEKRKITDHFPKMDMAKKPKEAVEYPLKGFLLYFEENSQTVSQEENIIDEDKVREKCVEIWSNFTSDEKSKLWLMIFRYQR